MKLNFSDKRKDMKKKFPSSSERIDFIIHVWMMRLLTPLLWSGHKLICT